MEPFSFASSDTLDYPVSIRMWVPLTCPRVNALSEGALSTDDVYL
jgi:hypothetical protein